MNDPVINQDTFDQYRVSEYDPEQSFQRVLTGTPQVKPSITTSSLSGTSSSRSGSIVTDFRKGIKRDKSHYRTLKDEKQWEDWRRSTTSTICAHGCENIISPSYSPTTPEETLLFEEQQKCMHDVFNTIMQTSMGKCCVRNHESAPVSYTHLTLPTIYSV